MSCLLVLFFDYVMFEKVYTTNTDYFKFTFSCQCLQLQGCHIVRSLFVKIVPHFTGKKNLTTLPWPPRVPIWLRLLKTSEGSFRSLLVPWHWKHLWVQYQQGAIMVRAEGLSPVWLFSGSSSVSSMKWNHDHIFIRTKVVLVSVFWKYNRMQCVCCW